LEEEDAELSTIGLGMRKHQGERARRVIIGKGRRAESVELSMIGSGNKTTREAVGSEEEGELVRFSAHQRGWKSKESAGRWVGRDILQNCGWYILGPAADSAFMSSTLGKEVVEFAAEANEATIQPFFPKIIQWHCAASNPSVGSSALKESAAVTTSRFDG
jgi:hypothetical protein